MTYAGYWVRQRILRAIEDQSYIIRVPAHLVASLRNVLRGMSEVGRELGREPSFDEVGTWLNMSAEQVEQMLTIAGWSVSMCSFVVDDVERSLHKFLEDETFVSPFDSASHKLLKEQIDKLLDQLTERQKKVLQLRFGLEDGHARTLEEVGRELNVTRERVRQVEGQALGRLRHPTRSEWLKGYLE